MGDIMCPVVCGEGYVLSALYAAFHVRMHCMKVSDFDRSDCFRVCFSDVRAVGRLNHPALSPAIQTEVLML